MAKYGKSERKSSRNVAMFTQGKINNYIVDTDIIAQVLLTNH